MKLYTEEQLLNTVKAVLEYDNEVRIEKHLKALQPIELPSDEEIEIELLEHVKVSTIDPYKSFYFKAAMYGAKLVKEQILNQNK